MTKTGTKTVFWDITNRMKKIKNLDDDSAVTTQLTDETIEGIKKKMDLSLIFMPFNNISKIPDDAKWEHVNNNNIEINSEVKIYELSYKRKGFNRSVMFKWRVFVEPKTNLPKKTYLYQKSTNDKDYTLTSVNEIKYLSNEEMQILLKDVF